VLLQHGVTDDCTVCACNRVQLSLTLASDGVTVGLVPPPWMLRGAVVREGAAGEATRRWTCRALDSWLAVWWSRLLPPRWGISSFLVALTTNTSAQHLPP
jgi:hypothetical protein